MGKHETSTQPAMETVQYPDDEIDLRELLGMLWRGKRIILLTTIVFAGAAVAYALSKPNIYQASVLLAPSQSEGNAGGIGGQLGGLASLAGINLGGGGPNKTVLAKEVLQSRAFLTDFIHRYNLSVPLMAAKGWNTESQSWQIDQEIYNPETNTWLDDEEGNNQKPTDWDMVNKFKQEHLSVSENTETGMVTLKINSQSPRVAKEWAEKLVFEINEHMRKEDVREAEARIAFLEGKLSETPIAGMQQVFYQLIESETRTVMLANAQDEYVFKIVDPAVVPQKKSEPKRALIAILGTLLGGMIGIFIVFILAFVRSARREN